MVGYRTQNDIQIPSRTSSSSRMTMTKMRLSIFLAIPLSIKPTNLESGWLSGRPQGKIAIIDTLSSSSSSLPFRSSSALFFRISLSPAPSISSVSTKRRTRGVFAQRLEVFPFSRHIHNDLTQDLGHPFSPASKITPEVNGSVVAIVDIPKWFQ